MAAKSAAFALPRWAWILASLAGFLLVGVTLYLAQAILIPIALAVLITFLLSPFVTRLQRLGLPRIAAVLAVTLLAAGVVGLTGWVVGSQVVRLVDELPRHETEIVEKVAQLNSLQKGGAFEKIGETISKVQKRVEQKTEDEKPTPRMFGVFDKPIPVEVVNVESEFSTVATYLGPFVEPLATAGLVVVLVIFMLIKREDLRNRIVTLSGGTHLAVTTKALDEAGHRIARFLLMQFVINVCYGVAVTLGTLALGVPYAALWGVAAAVLRYVPYVGPMVSACLPIGYSLMTGPDWGPPLGTWWQPAATLALIVVLELLVNNVAEPLLYGRGVGVSEVAIILAAVFWGWLWGAVGLVLATPLTACLVVAGRYVPALAVLTRILGDEPDFEPHIVYYQRLLAKDDDEAEEVFDEQAARIGFTAACEQVVVPTLEMAKRDRLRGLIEADQQEFIIEAIEEHIAQAAATPAEAEEPLPAADERPLVLGYRIRDAEDEAAVALLARLLADAPVRFEVLPRTILVSEAVERVRESAAAGICLVGISPGGVTHARSLAKRFRAALPDLKIAVGRWGRPLDEKRRTVLRDSGIAYVGRSPTETYGHVLSMARLRPAAEPRAAG